MRGEQDGVSRPKEVTLELERAKRRAVRSTERMIEATRSKVWTGLALSVDCCAQAKRLPQSDWLRQDARFYLLALAAISFVPVLLVRGVFPRAPVRVTMCNRLLLPPARPDSTLIHLTLFESVRCTKLILISRCLVLASSASVVLYTILFHSRKIVPPDYFNPATFFYEELDDSLNTLFLIAHVRGFEWRSRAPFIVLTISYCATAARHVMHVD